MTIEQIPTIILLMTTIGGGIAAVVALWRSYRIEAQTARLSELQRLQKRVDELITQVDVLTSQVAMWARYSGHLQYLLSRAGQDAPTFDQYAQMIQQHQSLTQVKASPTPEGAPEAETEQAKP